MRTAVVTGALAMAACAWAAAAHAGEELTLPDLKGASHPLGPQPGAKATVYFFLGTECPVANRYLGRVAAIAADFAPRGVVVLGVNPHALESVEQIRVHAERQAIPFPVLLDRDQRAADRFAVESVPVAILLDATGAVRYQGMVDDNKDETIVHQRYLRDALEAVLGGTAPAIARTEPRQGCQIQRALAATPAATVTWAEPVGKILHQRCVECHRPGQVAPFSLVGYADARRWARDIVRRTQSGAMPPWKPVNRDTFRHERWMPPEEIATLKAWLDAGAPEGDPAKAPKAPTFPEGWALGEPDLVLTAQPYSVRANGPDEYRSYVLPTNFPEDRWVVGVDHQPGNRNVVHHILGFVDTSGVAARRDAADPAPGFLSDGGGPGFLPAGDLGGWAPGVQPEALPPGIGRLLPKGGHVVLQVHYHRNGRVESDQTRVGLYFAKAPVKQRLVWVELIRVDFQIPPGADKHKVIARRKVRADAHAHAVMPHMHLLGREIRVRAKRPDGSEVLLVDIPQWDFNWQDIYYFKAPIPLPEGTMLTLESVYDNSTGNPNNPHSPPRAVGWGDQTTDEMCLAFVSVTRDAEDLTAPPPPDGAGK